jgi:hypothetical protein
MGFNVGQKRSVSTLAALARKSASLISSTWSFQLNRTYFQTILGRAAHRADDYSHHMRLRRTQRCHLSHGQRRLTTVYTDRAALPTRCKRHDPPEEVDEDNFLLGRNHLLQTYAIQIMTAFRSPASSTLSELRSDALCGITQFIYESARKGQ